MTKLISTGNCWTAFLACITDQPLDSFEHCSTVNDDWKEKTEERLAGLGLYFCEVNPGLVSQLPDEALVGAHVNGISKPHIVIAKVKRNGPRHAFSIYHDPSGRRIEGTPIEPQRIVLLCRLDKV